MTLPILHLVACCSEKLSHAAPARDLYCSRLFKMTRAVVEREPWAILSAKYGLVLPDTVIEPYDVQLGGKIQSVRQQWADGVLAVIPKAERYVLWTGMSYAEFLEQPLRAERPLRGLGIGMQYAYLRALLATRDISPMDGIRMAIDLLVRCDPRLTPDDDQMASDADWDRTLTTLRAMDLVHRQNANAAMLAALRKVTKA